MELGKIELDGAEEFSTGRHFSRTDTLESKDSFYNDLPRLMLLLFMLVAAIVGWYVKSYSNQPDRVIAASVEQMLKKPFNASIEGSVGLKSFTLGTFRSRQRYFPGSDLVIVSDRGYAGGEQVPYDALSALEALLTAIDFVELGREDMYGHGTRHFSGVIPVQATNGAGQTAGFDLWVGLKTRRVVRLVMTTSERSNAFDDSGQAVFKSSYLNISYRE